MRRGRHPRWLTWSFVRVAVVAPTYQEAGNIVRFLETVRAAAPEASIIIVDDNSPDGTGRLAEETGTRIGDVQVIHRAGKLGLGSAYREGFQAALDLGVDVVVSMDVDFSHDPNVIPKLLGLIENGADVALGSRYVPGGGTVNWPWHRRMLSRWGNRYTAFILDLPVRDCTGAFRAVRAEVLRAVRPDSTRAEGYAMLTEFVRRFARGGYTIAEYPITFVDRVEGVSKMSGRIVAESMVRVTLWGIRDRVQRLRAAVGGRRRS